MSRPIDPAELVGAAEIAERLGLAFSQTVHDWRRRHSEFPKPVATLKMGLVWFWPDVEAWARTSGRLVKKAARSSSRDPARAAPAEPP